MKPPSPNLPLFIMPLGASDSSRRNAMKTEAVVEKFNLQWHDAPVELACPELVEVVAIAIAYCIFD